jgi:hypothetical protein
MGNWEPLEASEMARFVIPPPDYDPARVLRETARARIIGLVLLSFALAFLGMSAVPPVPQSGGFILLLLLIGVALLAMGMVFLSTRTSYRRALALAR